MADPIQADTSHPFDFTVHSYVVVTKHTRGLTRCSKKSSPAAGLTYACAHATARKFTPAGASCVRIISIRFSVVSFSTSSRV